VMIAEPTSILLQSLSKEDNDLNVTFVVSLIILQAFITAKLMSLETDKIDMKEQSYIMESMI